MWDERLKIYDVLEMAPYQITTYFKDRNQPYNRF